MAGNQELIKAKLAKMPPDNKENGTQFYINLLDQNPEMKTIFEGKIDKDRFEKAGYDFLMCMTDLANNMADETKFKDIVAHLAKDLQAKGVTLTHLEKAPNAFFKLLDDKAGGANEKEQLAFNEFFKKFLGAAKAE